MITLTDTLKPYRVSYWVGLGASVREYIVLAENDQSAEAKARKALNKKYVNMNVQIDGRADGWIL